MVVARSSDKKVNWAQYGTGCLICGAKPFHACLDTRGPITGTPTVPKARPHVGRRVTVRKPYPKEAAVRAAATRIANQRKLGGKNPLRENWKKRGYRPSTARKRQLGIL